MDSWILFCFGTMIASVIMIVVKVIRARVIAGRAGILKVCVNWVSLIIQLAACVVFVFFGVNRYSQAEKLLRAARQNEMIAGRLNGINDGDYYHAAMKTENRQASLNTDQIQSNIIALRKNSRAYKAFSFFCFTLAFSELLFSTSAFWYITNAGVVLVNFKMPEPFYASLNGDKIDINYMARLANVNKVKSFKATPKNMEIFGRFIAQGYPQYPQYPPNQQIPQYPQNMPYAQYPQQYQQFPQKPQPPQDPQNPTSA